ADAYLMKKVLHDWSDDDAVRILVNCRRAMAPGGRVLVAETVVPVAWPPVAELLGKVVERKIPIYACGTCARARGITEADLANWGAKYGNPKIFVSLIEWADRVITE
ncbi:MAG: methyltransferase, partial [Gemmatimonadales bacterium]